MEKSDQVIIFDEEVVLNTATTVSNLHESLREFTEEENEIFMKKFHEKSLQNPKKKEK